MCEELVNSTLLLCLGLVLWELINFFCLFLVLINLGIKFCASLEIFLSVLEEFQPCSHFPAELFCNILLEFITKYEPSIICHQNFLPKGILKLQF